MPDAPTDALTAGSWLRRSGRLIAASQRLLVFPLGVATLPAAFAADAADTFSAVARYAVQVDERLLDGLADEAAVDALEYALLAAALLARPLAQAWLTGSFLRSLAEGRIVRFPGWPVFGRLLLFYGALLPLFVGIAALARVEGIGPWVALLGAAALAVPTITADYAIGLDELSVPDALRASVHSVRRAPRLALLAFWLTYLLGFVVFALFDNTIADADEVFPLFLVAAALADGLARYVVDCALIVFYLGDREL